MFHKLRTQVGVIALLLITIFLAQSVLAEQTNNPNLTLAEVQELQMYISKEKSGKTPLSWKKEALGYADGFWFQSVIETDGVKITLAYFPESPASGISLWWRKKGTSSRKELWSSSVKPDGTAGGGSDPGSAHNCFPDRDPSIGGPIGPEHKAFWQSQVNNRLRAVLEYYRKK